MRSAILGLIVMLGAVLFGVQATRNASPAAAVPVPTRMPDPCPNDRSKPMPAALRLPATVPPGEPT
ncbi:MAG: hypothetical protein QOJ39_2737, partial [Candidatus Eremiobacteraeota bacterium]|nr:hypothetical protein [Candidatus Eremiobacteraeota bacterium]